MNTNSEVTHEETLHTLKVKTNSLHNSEPRNFLWLICRRKHENGKCYADHIPPKKRKTELRLVLKKNLNFRLDTQCRPRST